MGAPTATNGLRERKKRATRENIAQAALTLFEEHGYDETTLAEVAEAAGVALRTIFSYFESKDDIVFSEERCSTNGWSRCSPSGHQGPRLSTRFATSSPPQTKLTHSQAPLEDHRCERELAGE